MNAAIGFSMHEKMTGTHDFEPGCGPEGHHFLEFEVDWGPRSLRTFLLPGPGFMRAELKGHVTVGGLCERAPCNGIFELRYFTDRRIRYEFEFEADGEHYRYVGEKVNILPWNLPVSHTTCFGTLTKLSSRELVSRSVTFFRLATAPAFLSSLRLRRPKSESTVSAL